MKPISQTNKKVESIFWWVVVILILWYTFVYRKYANNYSTEKIKYPPTDVGSIQLLSRLENAYTPKKLSIEQLRCYPGLSSLSDEEALEKIDGLYKLSILTYKIHSYGA